MNIFQAISYMFLGATNGYAMLIITTLINVVFYKLNKQDYTIFYKLLLEVLLPIISVVGILSYTDIFSLLPVFAIIFIQLVFGKRVQKYIKHYQFQIVYYG